MDWSTLVIVLVAAAEAFTSAVGGRGGNPDVDALSALRRSLTDPNKVLETWDSSLVSACTWIHISCEGEKVIRVSLGDSNLSGKLVPELGQLQNLQYLQLYKNKLEGTIPTELGNIKSLVSLDLYENKLTGTIPPSLGNLKNLIFLRLYKNQLTGTYPKELSGATNLKVVDVSGNKLTGPLPKTAHPFNTSL